MSKDILIKQIDALLPQTQCEKCDHPGCMPYAKAIVENGETINKCAPGGQITTDAIAELLDTNTLKASHQEQVKSLAVINEDLCVGCTICIRHCPTDAIIGAAKQMHTVLNDECTGCELCIEPCPMDCIEMVSINEPSWLIDNPLMTERAEKARVRFNNRNKRIDAQKFEAQKKHKADKSASIKAEILASVNRVKQKRINSDSKSGDSKSSNNKKYNTKNSGDKNDSQDC